MDARTGALHGEKMKKILLVIAILFCFLQASFAEAPELKNMMPNSWQKLTRLSGAEEKDFFQKSEVRTAIQSINNSFFSKTKIEEKYYQVFAETNCGIDFYRFLISDSPLEEGYNREYQNKTLTKEECLKMQGEKECIWQIVFVKNKKNELHSILVRPYAKYWVSQGEWEGYKFNDLMIKPLNKNEIGFFITEISVAFTADREKMKQNIVPINYHTCKNQIAASNNIDFAKYKIKENIISAWSKEGVSIQASACLFDSKCPLKYSIQNAFDGNPATSYVENTEDDLMKIEFSGFKSMFSKKVNLAIINGYALNEKYYYANNRIIVLNANSYKVNNEKTELIQREPIQLDLKDGIHKYQTVCFDYNNRVGSFSFSVAKIIKGDSYNDTCIAELNLKESNNFVFGDFDE